MDKSREYLIWLANSEFLGPSYNGPSLIETLRSLTAEEALSTETFEGYSAWGAALHVLALKEQIGRALGAKLPEHTHGASGWPPPPDSADQHAYDAMINELIAFHEPVVTAFADASSEKLDQEMPGWSIPLGSAFAWLIAHDTNHNTQIRNMGLASLKQK